MGGSALDAQRKAWNEAMRSAAGASALPPALQGNTAHRRSDRRKKQVRRDKARKVTRDASSEEYRAAVWMDVLEDVDPSTTASVDDEEEYDELEEAPSKRKRRKGGAAKKGGALPKRFKPRSFASILLEEAGRADGVSKSYLDAEARLAPSERVPRRKFCPVTGQLGIYTNPKSGIPYANLNALEQIQERAPPWISVSGAAAYIEAVKSLRNEA